MAKIILGGQSWNITDESAHIKTVRPDGVVASDSGYDADKTATSLSQREAIPSGALGLFVMCDASSTNYARYRFGDSTVTATTNTGFKLKGGQNLSEPVPPNATHWAYIADTTAASTVSVILTPVWG